MNPRTTHPHLDVILKRVALWTIAVVVLPAGYFAGAPFALFAVRRYAPELIPLLEVAYCPVWLLVEHGFPGEGAYAAYWEWAHDACEELHAL